MADSSTEQDKWKHKYLESLEQLEKRERNWREADQLLRRGFSRVALISHGVDATLDNQLKKLRTALQNNADADAINEIVEKISLYMKSLDEQRAGHAAALEPAAVLLQVVEAVNFPLSLVAPVSLLKVNLAQPDASDHLKPLIDEFARLVAAAFYGDAVAPESAAAQIVQQPEEKKGWLQRVFKKDERRDEKSPTVEPVQDLTPEPAATAARVEQVLVAAAATSDSVVENVFLKILESLTFPAQFSERVQQLKEQLSKGLSASAIKTMTESVVALVVDMRSTLEHEKEELENFLQQLTQRLTELDAMVEGAESQRLASLAGGRQLDAVVKAQVNVIENTVQSSTDLPHMKSAIQGSLEKIRLHLAEQREQEERRQEALEMQLKSLTNKLQYMEGESQQLRQRLAKERVQAQTDPLTGAPNRLAFEQRVAQEFARWQRYKHSLTLLLCDVDYFKKINDTYGHKAGDRALMAIVKTIQFHLRETDFLARVGGEEFVVLLPDTTQEAAAVVAEKLRMSVEHSEFVYQGKPVPITISGGYAQFQPGDTVDEIYQRADKALYRAKHKGRNQFVAVD
jgi:diguanylate cyclase